MELFFVEEMGDLLKPKDMEMLKRVSLGEEKADLVISGGDLVNVYSGELLKDYSVAIKERWVAFVGPDASHSIGPDTEVIDASGKVLIPGFVDGHAHMILYGRLDEVLRYAMMGGTTTIITEIMEFIYPLGYSGLIGLLDNLRDQPVKVFATVPTSITFSRDAQKRAPSVGELIELLHRQEVLGVGEGFWQEVLRGDTNFATLSAEALRLRKTIEGHAAGCRAEKLSAYADFGVSSCHESISAEEVLEKLRLGIYVMIREGSIRRELEAIAKIRDMPLDFRRLALVSDGVDPRDLTENGYMESVVQHAINLGFDPIVSIQMATLNPAEHFGLDNILGGIAPGKHADILIIPELQTVKAETVISKGLTIAQDGELKVKPREVSLPLKGLEGSSVNAPDFTVRTDGKNLVKVRVMDQVSELVTRESFLELKPQDGELRVDPETDLLKVSHISCEGRIFTGFIKGHGFGAGALATSDVWETSGITVVGANEEDMALAVNRIYELGGGVVLYVNGQMQAELPLPIAGLITRLSMEETAQRLHAIQRKAEALGFPYPNAALTLATLTTPAIPFLRISEDGLVDVRSGQVVELLVS
ncbi:MAG: adenine deaminase C-terminal domain-containing protein [Desulfobacteraceae bacterium]|jgi:adenine deaminase